MAARFVSLTVLTLALSAVVPVQAAESLTAYRRYATSLRMSRPDARPASLGATGGIERLDDRLAPRTERIGDVRIVDRRYLVVEWREE